MPLPNGYTQLEYIQSSGTQYINTGYKNTGQNLRIVLDFRYTAAHSATTIFGSQGSNSSAVYTICPYGTGPYFYVGTKTNLSMGTTAVNTDYILDVTAKNGTLSVYWNGTLKQTTYTGSLNTTDAIALFGNNVSGTVQQICAMRVRSFQIYDGGVLKRDMIPAKNSGGAVGMYDLVGGTFYPNAGSGTFAAGAEIIPPEPGVNQLVVNSETLFDLTADTVSATTLAKGVTAHGSMGELITGKASAVATGTCYFTSTPTISGLPFRPVIVAILAVGTATWSGSTSYHAFYNSETGEFHRKDANDYTANPFTINNDGFTVSNSINGSYQHVWIAIG